MIRLVTSSPTLVDSSQLTTRQRVRLFLRLQRYVWPIWDKILLRILSTQVLAFMSVIPIYIGVRLVDDALVGRNAAVLFECVLMVLAVRTVEQVFMFVSNVMTFYSMQKTALNMSIMFYRHVQRLSVSQFTRRPVGEQMFRCTADVTDSSWIVSEVIPMTASALQRLVALGFVVSTLGAWLFVPIGIYLVFFFGVRQRLSTLIRHWDRLARRQGQELSSVLREILSAFRLIQGYNRRSTALHWYGSQLFRTTRAGWRRGMFVTVETIFVGVAAVFFMAIVNTLTGMQIIRGEMTLGEYAAVAAAVGGVLAPVQELIHVFQWIRQKLVPAERLLETLDVVPEIQDPPSPVTPPAQGRVEVRNVSFSYNGTPVLHDVSLVANPGEKVALVGRNGAGKTTLALLLLRLYEPTKGAILVDGVDLREWRQQELRGRLGMVMQEPCVFATTVRDNIAYGRPGAEDDDVVRAAQVAEAHAFIEELPHGYDTPLAEGGTISGGQKQRLCLARGVVRSPNILILDEATSALDPITESRVVANIDLAFAGRTRIVIAHNLISARNADRIYVMDRGRVVETGTHEALMAQKGAYWRLWTERKNLPEPDDTPPATAVG